MVLDLKNPQRPLCYFHESLHRTRARSTRRMAEETESFIPQEDDDDGLEERRNILQRLFRGSISTQSAAEQIASISLQESDAEDGLIDTWMAITDDAKVTSEHHESLSRLMDRLSRLPSPTDEAGNQLKVNSERIWGNVLVRIVWAFG